MKSADFIYHRAGNLAEALGYLEDYGGGARVLAGGQSLVPMMNLRLWRPAALVDVNGLAELAEIRCEGEATRVGALVRYATLERAPEVAERLPLIKTMVRFIGDHQVRNRGTIGGSLVQGDPTGEMPLACLVLRARAQVRGARGSREIPLEELYEGSYAARLTYDEILTEVVFPKQPARWAFREVCRRHNDFALVSVAAVGEPGEDGRWRGLRLGLGGVNDTPVLAEAAMRLLEGSLLSDSDIAAAAEAALEAIDPPSDVRGSAEYRTHLVPIYVARVLRDLRTPGETSTRV